MLNVLKQEVLVLEREQAARCTAAERSVPTTPQRVGPRRSRAAHGTAASGKNCP